MSGIHMGASVLRDLDLDNLVSAIPTFTQVGAHALKERLSNPIADDVELASRQSTIRSIKARYTDDMKALRIQLRDNEDRVRSVAEAAADTRNVEYYTQILWSADSRLAFLNKFGWLNELIVGLRTLFLPAISVLLPVLVFVAPIIFWCFVAEEAMTVENYFAVLQKSLKAAMPSVLGKPRFAGTGGIAEFGEQFIQIGVAIAMFVASIWNQISAAIAMRAVVADMRGRATAVAIFTEATRSLATSMGVPICSALHTPWADGELGIFGHAWNDPARIQEILAFAGHLDMLAALASLKRTCFPLVSLAPLVASSLQLTDVYHPGVSKAERVYNSVRLAPDISGQKNNVLLTGPNRGGKSTLLKAIGITVLMAHTVGVVFAREAQIPRFANIITALSPQDVVGKLSLFEAEIEFAKDVKVRLAAGGPTFLMMDEIFHGTNAHDGVEASQVFLDQLYDPKVAGLFSIVSTHYMDLPKRYGRVQHLCMDASLDPKDPERLVYTYKVREGVNSFSSVREILKERGL